MLGRLKANAFPILLVCICTTALYLELRHKKVPAPPPPPPITSFEECAKKYPVMTSYPPQCATPDGKHFTQDIGNELEVQDLITIEVPRPQSEVVSPLVISGKAKGSWFFEASFPVELQSATGTTIARGQAKASGNWMTEDFVSYTLNLDFSPQPKGALGKLILKKDNPSGDPAHDNALIVPVVF